MTRVQLCLISKALFNYMNQQSILVTPLCLLKYFMLHILPTLNLYLFFLTRKAVVFLIDFNINIVFSA